MATFKQSTGKTIQEAFEQFDRNNPHVWQLFLKEVRRAVKAGKKKVSAKAIVNYLRWEMNFTTTDDVSHDEGGFKICDAYHSRYARKFVDTYPDYAYLFDLKQLRSE